MALALGYCTIACKRLVSVLYTCACLSCLSRTRTHPSIISFYGIFIHAFVRITKNQQICAVRAAPNSSTVLYIPYADRRGVAVNVSAAWGFALHP